MDIFLNGIPLEEVYYGIENSVCPDCAEIELLHEHDEDCDDYCLWCAWCI